MLGVFRLESQMLPGNGKFEKTGIGSDREAKESINTAFNFLKANGNRISGAISTITKDYFINYQDLQGIGMTGKLSLHTLIAMCSIALGKPTLSGLAVLGEISISGTMMKVDELANSLQHTNDTNDTNDIIDTKILNLIRENPSITQTELKEKLQVSIVTVKRLMADLQKRGLIGRQGSSRKGKWIIIGQKE